jgi:hypothetical protein
VFDDTCSLCAPPCRSSAADHTASTDADPAKAEPIQFGAVYPSPAEIARPPSHAESALPRLDAPMVPGPKSLGAVSICQPPDATSTLAGPSWPAVDDQLRFA